MMKETCSECVRDIPAEYSCGWCTTIPGVCTVRKDCQISNETQYIEHKRTSTCPFLKIKKVTTILLVVCDLSYPILSPRINLSSTNEGFADLEWFQ